MTLAEMKYRDYVPYGWISSTFCSLEFIGKDADLFNKKWAEIRAEKYNCALPEYTNMKNELLQNTTKRDALAQKLRNQKKWWKFWKSPTEKELEQELRSIDENIDRLNFEIKLFSKNMFYSNSELIVKAKTFLCENGFILKTANIYGSECVTHSDVWEMKG